MNRQWDISRARAEGPDVLVVEATKTGPRRISQWVRIEWKGEMVIFTEAEARQVVEDLTAATKKIRELVTDEER